MYQKIILASGSPRRRELFTRLGINFQYTTSATKEEFNENEPIEQQVMKVAAMKAYDVARIYDEAFIVAADTIVYCENRILGKPRDVKDAQDMLNFLSGKMHEVITGVVVINKNHNIHEQFYDKTEVYFKKLNNEMINWYIDSEEPMDKAGAYAIQGKGSLFVEKIIGNYDTVVGLPVGKLLEVFAKLGIRPYGGFHEI
ncbi:MAG: septum formation protein Maf [Calditerrivibrio nitroreducens]|uniref:dTTP/UTP pyrophosphatase n=1 Tax=Calditerrivibrio nitroreducens TaxID=477976 RepID=A0A2J6WQH1_9BACT|nr:MAG: septum formation protein Maf [Calditerrivibrio nitroreducens]